ncbi:MAG TPA: tubulin-like doman-containing protein [Gemmataceae bacterium]|nr:tubulin-like doman-containing protein [Gemmataceae bacterium]
MAEAIPGYRLLKHLGSGFFGDVWKAEAADGKLCALKIIAGNWPQGKVPTLEDHLKNLARIATIRHPRLLTLERIELIDHQLVLIMELAEKNLWDRFRECREQGLSGIPATELRGYFEEAAEIIDLMIGQQQIPHGDLKPRNLFLVDNHVKIGDFGQAADLQILKSGFKGGSNPVYAAPEIFDASPGAFSDQYSLAVIYQELLTGERPFLATTLYQLMTQHLHAQPHASILPEKDQPAVRRALSKKPDVRFPSCMEFIHALAPADKAEEPAKPSVVVTPGAETLRRAPTPSADAGSLAKPVKPAPAVPLVEEMKGDGVLIPALVIGVGRTAVPMLHRVRAALMDRYGTLDHLPNIRWLYIDIDPTGIAAAQEGTPGIALSAQEVLLTRLNTTDHYEKGIGLRVPIASWLNPLLLYRIQRSLLTGGVRCLGRLAFMDHYSVIVQRLREELKTCSQLKALAGAARSTGLVMRTNWPRIYLAAHLAGGTGGGMFIDLAYLARDVLRTLGYPADQIDGLLFLPTAEGRGEKPAPFANTFAALNELNHFGSPNVRFHADYGDPDGILADDGAPFRRCVFLPAKLEEGKESTQRATELAAGYLFGNLVTPLGRVADDRRKKNSSAVVKASGSDTHHSPLTTHHAIGMFRFSWPKRLMIQQAARRLCRKLVERWMAPVNRNASEVRGWLTEQWAKRRLEPDHILARLQEACEKAWKKKPEDVLSAISAQYMTENAPKLDGAVAENAIAHVEQLAGKPRFKPKPGQSAPPPINPSIMERTFSDITRSLSAECEKELAEICVCALDDPGLRLAGAELAVPQILNLIDSLERKEGQHREAYAETTEVAYERLQSLAGQLEGLGAFLRRGNAAAELVQFFYLYPKARFQELSSDGVLSVIRALRNAYGRNSKDIGMCRQRLQEFHRSLGSQQPFKESAAGAGPGISILPLGCGTLEEAVKKFVAEVSESELADFDRKVQESLQTKLKSLVQICLSSQAPQLLGELEILMQAQGEKFMAARMRETDAADFFLKQYQQDADIAKDIVGAFHQAAPDLAKPQIPNPKSQIQASEGGPDDGAQNSGREIHVLTAPTGPAGEQFAEHARTAMKEIDLAVALGSDDILFYREAPGISLSDLPQLGPKFQQAYQEMSAQQNFTLHSREDITGW